ncbi:peptidoglycan DD-metalloendopeptidase family protein [Methylocystis suflitae]|uniref:peptidoglycan DD-metalloendopeptidase family protein n=1 Tax=Methylocystis suflitae TaxID=2951405 RepID=UPI00210E6694|nr:peptidoglycan DD-metalloendopeptidase family protein [Methylocystis suflitae]MCQ4189082.1 peptidoglycan DD-metalloendopeptidase family protein [Methylocystis suflitae]
MVTKHHIAYSRAAVRFLAAAGVAALVAGCSDASRFGGDPFSDPFSGSAKTTSLGVDRAPVGAIADAPAQSQPSTTVETRPLPAPSASASAQSGSASMARTTNTPAAQPSPTRVAAAGTSGHWSAEGGTPIVVSQGETAALLATRYGVPTDALLRANGFNVASQVQPGSRLVIPVYRAGAAPVVATHAPAGPAKAAAAVPAATKPIAAKPAPLAKSVVAGKPVEQAKPVRKTEAEPTKTKPIDKPIEKSKAAATTAPEKSLVKAEPRIAATTPARAVKTERIARGPSSPEAPEAESKIADARSKPVVAETPKETPSAHKVDTTATASIPPANDAKAVASDEGRPEFRWPARGRIIQGFTSGGNDGINIAVPEGTQVKAAEGGVVAYAGSELKGYGNLVLIRHPNGFVSAYAHNGELDVKRGDQVKRGQTIAKSGQSGNVGSPQLHFELRKGSTPVDPTRYLAGL